ncbi:hypothetical protein CHUAL_012669 [Chamberlinius hualienensis]
MGPGLRLQPKASQKKVQSKLSVAWKWWTHPETLALIDVWGEAMEEHCKNYKGKRILPFSAYEKIAKRLGENGVRRSVEQIREKIKTLKKSFWGALAKNGGVNGTGRINGKRQSVIEKMKRVLQVNGNIVKGKYTRQANKTNNQEKTLRKSKRGKKFQEIDSFEKEEEDEEEPHEMHREDVETQIDLLQGQEMNGDDVEEVQMGITVEPEHVHGLVEQWDMNGTGHMINDGSGGGESSGSAPSEGRGEITYDYPLCQVIENTMNKFLRAQRESEERFLLLEEQRMKAENKRLEAMQKRDEQVISEFLQTQERWRKEDREQELRIWAALSAKLGGSSHNKSKSDVTPDISQFLLTQSLPVQWQFAGTFRPLSENDSVHSSSNALVCLCLTLRAGHYLGPLLLLRHWSVVEIALFH